ncbi:MAG: AI-2E family transporter [Clostridiales bacterium]|nr:AI-2E family transporter [Clostridiales bacterium]
MDWKGLVRIGGVFFLLYLAIYYWSSVEKGLALLIGAAMPLVVGMSGAYILNILMSFYERHYFPKAKKRKKLVEQSRRPVCLVAAIVTLIAVITILVRLVIPELWAAIGFLAQEVEEGVKKLLNSEWAAKLLTEERRAELNATNWEELLSKGAKLLWSGLGGAAGAVAGVLTSVFSMAVTAFTGCIFSIYLLLDKEKLQSQCGRLMQAYLPEKWHGRIGHVVGVLNGSFHRYIVGQCTEALILGSLCAVGMLLFRFPYAGMIGALVGFTALIPIAGAYIGAGVGAIMMLTVSPGKAILFLIFIVVLQQLEGNLIYPKVVGKSMGLPPLWVMGAVTIGGGLMGILGMLLGVPLAAAAYQLIREALNDREKKKEQPAESRPT